MARRIRGKNEGSLHQRPNGAWPRSFRLTAGELERGSRPKPKPRNGCGPRKCKLIAALIIMPARSPWRNTSQWLESHRVSLRPKTADQYQRVIEKHILPHLGNIQVKNLRITRVEQFYSELVQSGMGVRTVRIVHTILHKALEKALRYSLVMSNPAHGASLPRYSRRDAGAGRDAGQPVPGSRHSSPFEALYHLAVTTGMRQGELFGLKWTDLQWHSGR